MAPTVIVEGTWERKYAGGWADGDSKFVKAAVESGVVFVDRNDPFKWDTALDGIWGKNSSWISAAAELRWYVHHKTSGEAVNIIAHSHGGQVVALALSQGLRVSNLITVATPVREDILPFWEKGAPNLKRWVHIHSDAWRDRWQVSGSFFDGYFGLKKRMPPPAENIFEPRGHSELLDSSLWSARGWWKFLEA